MLFPLFQLGGDGSPEFLYALLTQTRDASPGKSWPGFQQRLPIVRLSCCSNGQELLLPCGIALRQPFLSHAPVVLEALGRKRDGATPENAIDRINHYIGCFGWQALSRNLSRIESEDP